MADATNFIVDENGCWEWQGPMKQGVTPIFPGKDRRNVRKFIFEREVGLIDEGMFVKCGCGNNKCVNYEHSIIEFGSGKPANFPSEADRKRAYYEKNKDKQREANRRHYDKNKKLIMQKQKARRKSIL